jgi:hypothetical protein
VPHVSLPADFLQRILSTEDIDELRMLAVKAFRRVEPDQRFSVVDHDAASRLRGSCDDDDDASRSSA